MPATPTTTDSSGPPASRSPLHTAHLWTAALAGALLIGIGAALMVATHIGPGGWDLFALGLTHQLPISQGTATAILSATSVLIGWKLGIRPTLYTWVYVAIIGIIIDTTLALVATSVVGMWTAHLAGAVLVGIGVSLYTTTQLGFAPYDVWIPLLERVGVTITWTMVILNIVTAAAGWLLGGPLTLGALAPIIGVAAGVWVAQHTISRWLLPTPTLAAAA